MRKLVSYLVISLDGVIDCPQNWVFDHFDEDLQDHLADLTSRQDAIVLGRRTYDGWAGFWPTSTHEPFASFINGTAKYVPSSTLREASWAGTTILRGDITEEMQQLKRAPGADIGVHGSARLVRSLLQQRLLDELRLAVVPTLAGRGQRLFPDDDDQAPSRMDLVWSRETSSGALLLNYRPRPT